jgi:hypothetical protein
MKNKRSNLAANPVPPMPPALASVSGSTSRSKARNYYVEGTGWFVVSTANKKRAHSIGVEEYGRGNVRCVREATQDETESFISQKGKDALSDAAQ